jgi:LmbE family N-acetylglucosaminyl deacetylase
MRLAALFGALLALVAGAAAAPLDVGKGERLLVVAPHPDDEALGAGGLIQRVLARDGTVRVVLVTAGDGYIEAVQAETRALRPRPADFVAYGQRRLGEARAAMRRLGGERVRLGLLGFPDGGLDRLLRAHWWRTDPERSTTTGASRPPYREALEGSVTYDGDDLRRELLRLLRESQPTIVALPDPLDRHPDHRAAGLFTLMAIDDWTSEGARMPRLLAYLVHWPGWPPGWDEARPRDQDRVYPLELPAELPARDATRVALALSEREEKRKADAVASYTSQQEVMPGLLAAFVRRTEPFTLLTAAEVKRVGDAMEPSHR